MNFVINISGLIGRTLVARHKSRSCFYSRVHQSPHSFFRIIAALLFTMASNVDAKLLKSTKFPPEFSQKVDMQKVNVEVMKK